jgi:signal transduction histidine kinase
LVVSLAVFALGAVTGMITIDRMRNQLVGEATKNAKEVLAPTDIASPSPTADISADEVSYFYYRGPDGTEYSELSSDERALNQFFFDLTGDNNADAAEDDGTTEEGVANELAEVPGLATADAPESGDVEVVARDGNVIAVEQTIAQPDGRSIVVGYSVPRASIDDAAAAYGRIVVVAVPTLAILAGLLTWLATNRALRPVHLIAKEASTISASDLSARVPVPAGNDEINDLAVTLNRMLTRLDHANQQQRQFISDASHELRSPVAASLTQVEVALNAPDRTDWLKVGETVRGELITLSDLVNDLLLLNRLGEAPREMRDVDLDHLVECELRRTRSQPVSSYGIQPARVVGSDQLLSRVVRNLIDNAVTHGSAPVEVRLTHQGEHVELTVDDAGAGISPEQRSLVTQRFTRLDESRNRKDGGGGLGLAIVVEAVAVHRGEFRLDDSPLGGLRATVVLPTEAAPLV